MARSELYDQDTAESGSRGGVQIPSSGTGRRRTRDSAPQVGGRARRRHSAKPARRRASLLQRTARALRTAWHGNIGWVLPLVVLVASVGGVYLLTSDRLSGEDTPSPTSLGGLPSAAPPGPTALVVQLDAGGEAVAFTLFALDGAEAGTVVLLPSSSMVEIPGFGLDRLSRAVELGGVQLAELSLRNLLSLDFDHVAVVSPDDWEVLAGTLGEVEVDNPARLDKVDAQGRVEVLWGSGVVGVEAGDVAEFLAGRAIGETDLERLVRHQHFWTAYLDARRAIVGVVSDPTRGIDAFFDEAAVRSSELDYRILPVETVGGNDELYGVDVAGLQELLAVLAPTTAINGTARVRVQVLNGVGTPGLAEPVTALLLPTGAVVQLTGNALEFDHDVTQIVYYRDEHVGSALRIRDELGLGEVVKQREPIDVVDITVVVGRDLAALIAAQAAAS